MDETDGTEASGGAMAEGAAPPSNPRRLGFWEGELGYPQSILVVATAILIGVFFHWKVGYNVSIRPQAFVGFAIFAGLAIAVPALLMREDRVVRWLYGVPFAITSLVAVTVLALVGGVLPQETLQRELGVPSAFAAWPFLFACLLMQMNLVGSSIRRMWPPDRKNIQFILTHAGLAIALLGGAYGSISMKRYNLVLFEGVETDFAYDSQERMVQMPFTAVLKEFHLEKFPPVLGVATVDDKAQGGYTLDAGSEFVEKGMRERIGPYAVEVLEYLPKAAFSGEKWVEYQAKTSAPAALVKVSDRAGKVVAEGWVSSGGIETRNAFLQLGEETALVMPDPMPRKFRSDLMLDGKPVSVEVNQPINRGDMSLYQLSYDQNMGAASRYSVIEVVQDASLPVVWAGMLMLLAGVGMMLWKAPARRPTNGGRP